MARKCADASCSVFPIESFSRSQIKSSSVVSYKIESKKKRKNIKVSLKEKKKKKKKEKKKRKKKKKKILIYIIKNLLLAIHY